MIDSYTYSININYILMTIFNKDDVVSMIITSHSVITTTVGECGIVRINAQSVFNKTVEKTKLTDYVVKEIFYSPAILALGTGSGVIN